MMTDNAKMIEAAITMDEPTGRLMNNEIMNPIRQVIDPIIGAMMKAFFMSYMN